MEVVVAAQLSGDKVLANEIIAKLDTHADNQKQFNLPDRITAKRFIFKLLYGATAYGYYTDTDFISVGFTKDQWQEVIDKFYGKYVGIYLWHQQILHESQTNGKLTIPSGRYYPFSWEEKYNKMKWPDTKVKNYPVQGFGADLVMLARLEAFKQIKAANIEAKLVSTIHDSIVADAPSQHVEQVGKILYDSIIKVPKLCKQIWGYDFSLPLTSEVTFGPNKKDQKPLTFS